jgi:hypothetical protein
MRWQTMPLVIAVTLLLIRPAFAQWERISWDQKGTTDGTPPRSAPHPLQYYLTPSADRDSGHDLCLGCKTGGGQQVSLQDYDVERSQHLLGEAYGRKIFQIVLTFHEKPGSVVEQMHREWNASAEAGQKADYDKLPPVQWKSIVMESSPDVCNELYFIVDDGVYVRPLTLARVFTVGDTHLLATNDPIDGTGAMCTEGYWVLQPDAPWLLDLKPVHDEIGRVMPENSTAVQMGCWALSLDKGEVRSPIQDADAKCRACGLLGTAIVNFKIEGHRAVPVKS